MSLPFLSTQCIFNTDDDNKIKKEIKNDLDSTIEKVKVLWEKNNLDASAKSQIDVNNLNNESIKNELKFYNNSNYSVEIESISRDELEGNISVKFVLKNLTPLVTSKHKTVTFSGFKSDKLKQQEIIKQLNNDVRNVKITIDNIWDKYISDISQNELFYSGYNKNKYDVVFKKWTKNTNEIRITFILKDKRTKLESNNWTYTLSGFKTNHNTNGETKEDLDKIAEGISFDVDNKANILSSEINEYSQLKVFDLDDTKYKINYTNLEHTETTLKAYYQISNKENIISDEYVYEIEGFKTSTIPSVSPTLASSKIRIGMWNVLNLSQKSAVFKKYALASIIDKLNLDLIGIIENKTEASAQSFCEYLKTFTGNNNWEVIASNSSIHNLRLESNSKQHECPAFLYKKNILEVEKFDNGKNWLGYDNSTFVGNETDGSIGYVRPPMGVKFRTKGQIKNNFTFVIDHFDSPGAKKDNSETDSQISGQGTQEADEAFNLKNVMDWFDKHDGENDDLFFMGDTNIKLNNQRKAFDKILSDQYYKSLLNDDEQSKTSLKAKWNEYSEPYDKIFFKSNLKYENASFYPLYNVFNDGYIKNYATLNEWKTYINKTYKSGDAGFIKSAISDHCPIYFDLILSANDDK
ncbi:Uncharacterised protein [Mycoplasmopsis caviae]|uniref:Lipoprotein-associated type-17 domain-containing protein n=1 Tax=Mycoplasmopsis caviae TaxID=55603 RepID=A0A3P8KXG0_9BACT|nr:Uncharacterised protein [Mycoplasmopsis caviae]